MPGPKYNYLNVRDDLRIAEQGSGQISFRDGDLHISSSTDGQLDITGDTKVQVTSTTVELQGSTAVTLDGDTTVEGSHTFTTGTGLVTVGTGGITTTGHVSGANAKFSGTTLSGFLTIADDLTRRTAKYISGNVGRPTGYLNASGSGTPGIGAVLPSEGIIYLSGRSGSINCKLTTPTEGQTLSLIYIDSGNVAETSCTAKISSSGYQVGGSSTKYYYLTFNYAGDATTLAGIGTTWYAVHPSGMGGNTWSTT